MHDERKTMLCVLKCIEFEVWKLPDQNATLQKNMDRQDPGSSDSKGEKKCQCREITGHVWITTEA